MKILAISGSLRRVSTNTTVLRALGRLAPEGMQIALYEGLGALPQFNPDDEETAGPTVDEYRRRLTEADGVVICSPEYAHGVPGALKNALDWVVGTGELVDKPIALINASPRSTYAHASLTETLTVMNTNLVAEASVTVPVAGKGLDEAGIAADPEIAPVLTEALLALQRVVKTTRAAG